MSLQRNSLLTTKEELRWNVETSWNSPLLLPLWPRWPSACRRRRYRRILSSRAEKCRPPASPTLPSRPVMRSIVSSRWKRVGDITGTTTAIGAGTGVGTTATGAGATGIGVGVTTIGTIATTGEPRRKRLGAQKNPAQAGFFRSWSARSEWPAAAVAPAEARSANAATRHHYDGPFNARLNQDDLSIRTATAIIAAMKTGAASAGCLGGAETADSGRSQSCQKKILHVFSHQVTAAEWPRRPRCCMCMIDALNITNLSEAI
jgi:hypothetical protein